MPLLQTTFGVLLYLTSGGVYLDSDVEVLKSFNNLLNLPYFIGEEQGTNIEPAVIGCEKGWSLMGEMLEYYKNRHFVTEQGFDMETLPQIMSDKIRERYEYVKIASFSDFMCDPKKLCVFPAEFFSPKYPNGFRCPVTQRTYAIHHFAASWYPTDKKIFRMVRRVFGYQVAHTLSALSKSILAALKGNKANKL